MTIVSGGTEVVVLVCKSGSVWKVWSWSCGI